MRHQRRSRAVVLAAVLLPAMVTVAVAGGKIPKKQLHLKAKLPKGYQSQVTEGMHEVFTGMIATGPRNPADTRSALISVIVAPDVIHGGVWSDPGSQASYYLTVLSTFNQAGFDRQFVLVSDGTRMVDGVSARSILVEYDVVMPHQSMLLPPTRVREWSLFLKTNDRLYSITLSSDASDWPSRAREFDDFVDSVRFKEK